MARGYTPKLVNACTRCVCKIYNHFAFIIATKIRMTNRRPTCKLSETPSQAEPKDHAFLLLLRVETLPWTLTRFPIPRSDFTTHTFDRRSELDHALRAYCGRDMEAMIVLARRLAGWANYE